MNDNNIIVPTPAMEPIPTDVAALINHYVPVTKPLVNTALNSGMDPQFIKDEALHQNNPAAG